MLIPVSILVVPVLSNQPAKYYCPIVHGLYKFLLGVDVVIGKSTMTNIASFLNAHIKVEFLARHQAANSDNPCATTIRIGEDPAIQQLVTQVSQKKAKSNRELFLDKQANIDNRIAPHETDAMLWMAAGIGITTWLPCFCNHAIVRRKAHAAFAIFIAPFQMFIF
jgi:hypothetical protein